MYSLSQIQNFANLALDVYYSSNNNARLPIAPSWTRAVGIEAEFQSEILNDSASRLGLAVYQQGDTVVIAFDGWETGPNDFFLDEKVNALLEYFSIPDQYFAIGILFANYVAHELDIAPSSIQFVGHSQGGGIAALTADYFGASAYVFNPSMQLWPSGNLTDLVNLVTITNGNGEILLTFPTARGIGDLEADQALIIEQAEEVFGDVGITVEFTSSVPAGGNIEGIRINLDGAGFLTPPWGVTDVDEMDVSDDIGAILTQYHGGSRRNGVRVELVRERAAACDPAR